MLKDYSGKGAMYNKSNMYQHLLGRLRINIFRFSLSFSLVACQAFLDFI